MLSIPEVVNDPSHLTYPYHRYLDDKHAEICKIPHPRLSSLIIVIGCVRGLYALLGRSFEISKFVRQSDLHLLH